MLGWEMLESYYKLQPKLKNSSQVWEGELTTYSPKLSPPPQNCVLALGVHLNQLHPLVTPMTKAPGYACG